MHSTKVGIVGYRYAEKIHLYRSLLKAAFLYPLSSKRELVTEEIKFKFRDSSNDALGEEQIDHMLLMGWQRKDTIEQYAKNMYWFHSRDEVTKRMLDYSKERDQKRTDEMKRFKQVGEVTKQTAEVTEFFSTYYHYHPNYYHKIGKIEYRHPHDYWRTRGNKKGEVGGRKQLFNMNRMKSRLPNGW